ncbi:DUF47 domain-containing protein [Deinococcus maricopensis]|uniref:Putative phosphate transport regulator n=1 Tax=Deinococcus maricopensis (strain DSM 21211 / LMG 22137 / NRRL B-23946 / LB-34) TaxID=709986 RepID=E8UA28_DEIML|nr:DUF47 family protein [Deinococcus maricopensis]ADV67917.1 putative phosphate transport regulator [Deinococcus maricopensis DSM 21211]
MVFSRLLPKNPQFGVLFTRAAVNAHTTATALVDLCERFENVEAKVHRLRDLEHEGDHVSGQLTIALQDAFITPFDREDIIELNNHLDDFVDLIEEAGRRMWLYRIDHPGAPALQIARVIEQQAQLLAQAMPMIEDAGKSAELSSYTQQIRKLEDDADRISDAVQQAQYDGVTDIPGMIRAMRLGEIMALLEDATDQAQRVAKTIEGIILKNA